MNKNSRGHYILINIDSEYPAVEELNRVMSFNEDIIKDMTFSIEEHKKESDLFVSATAKDFKAGKIAAKKEPSEADKALDRVQFEI